MSPARRHAAWWVPCGYVLAFVLSWPGLIEPDDGSGLPWIGTFALGLPWSLLATVVVPGDGMSRALTGAFAAAGVANALIIAGVAYRWARRTHPS